MLVDEFNDDDVVGKKQNRSAVQSKCVKDGDSDDEVLLNDSDSSAMDDLKEDDDNDDDDEVFYSVTCLLT